MSHVVFKSMFYGYACILVVHSLFSCFFVSNCCSIIGLVTRLQPLTANLVNLERRDSNHPRPVTGIAGTTSKEMLPFSSNKYLYHVVNRNRYYTLLPSPWSLNNKPAVVTGTIPIAGYWLCGLDFVRMVVNMLRLRFDTAYTIKHTKLSIVP